MKDRSLHVYRVKQFQAFIYFLFFLFTVIMLLSVLFRVFGHDEFEHIHSAWYVAGGYLPYADFFQVHHPLLWYTLAPVILDLGKTMTAVFIMRFIMAFLTICSVYVVFRLAKLITRSKEVGLIAGLFLFSTVMFVEKGIQVRPDVPQVFFGLLSFYHFLFYFKNRNKPKYLCLSGLFLSLSFLFLQKSVFLLLVYAILVIYKLSRRELSLKATALFLLSFLLPFSSLVVYLLLTGAFPEYILTNWLVPARLLSHFSPFLILPGMPAENTLLWFLVIASCCALLKKSTFVNKKFFGGPGGDFSTPRRGEPQKALRAISTLCVGFCFFRSWGLKLALVLSEQPPGRRRQKRFISFFQNSQTIKKRELRMIIFVAIVLFVFACFMRRPFKQNFMLPMALFCIPAAYYFKVLCFKFKWNERKKSGALAAVVLIPFIILTTMIFETNRTQVEKIDYVIKHTHESDFVYDGDSRFNLFRKDLHYFWYGLKKGKEFDTYCRLTLEITDKQKFFGGPGGDFSKKPLGRRRQDITPQSTGKRDRCAGYDIYRLIREKKPKFISHTRLDITKGGLYRFYKKTRFKGLYIRVED